MEEEQYAIIKNLIPTGNVISPAGGDISYRVNNVLNKDKYNILFTPEDEYERQQYANLVKKTHYYLLTVKVDNLNINWHIKFSLRNAPIDSSTGNSHYGNYLIKLKGQGQSIMPFVRANTGDTESPDFADLEALWFKYASTAEESKTTGHLIGIKLANTAVTQNLKIELLEQSNCVVNFITNTDGSPMIQTDTNDLKIHKINHNGLNLHGLQVEGNSQFYFSGIEHAQSGTLPRPIWFGHLNRTGTPVYDNNLTYNPGLDGNLFSPKITGQLTWGGNHWNKNAFFLGPVETSLVADLGANRLAVSTEDADKISIEYSRDSGNTWSVISALSEKNKVAIFSGGVDNIGICPGYRTTSTDKVAATDQLKITILNIAGKEIYTYLNKIIIHCATRGCSGSYCTIKGKQKNAETWDTIVEEISLIGDDGYTAINLNDQYGICLGSSNSYLATYTSLEFIFGIKKAQQTSYSGGGSGLTIYNIFGYGGFGWKTLSNLAKNGHIYKYDSDFTMILPQNLEFQRKNKTMASIIVTPEEHANSGSSTKLYSSTVEIYGSDNAVTADNSATYSSNIRIKTAKDQNDGLSIESTGNYSHISFYPSVDNQYDLGSINLSKRWKNLYLSGVITTAGTITSNKGLYSEKNQVVAQLKTESIQQKIDQKVIVALNKTGETITATSIDLTTQDPNTQTDNTNIDFISNISQQSNGKIVPTKKTIPIAGQSINAGLITCFDQTIEGKKTFVDDLKVNSSIDIGNAVIMYNVTNKSLEFNFN